MVPLILQIAVKIHSIRPTKCNNVRLDDTVCDDDDVVHLCDDIRCNSGDPYCM